MARNVLFIGANPSGTDNIQLVNERDAIRDSLAAPEAQDQFEFADQRVIVKVISGALLSLQFGDHVRIVSVQIGVRQTGSLHFSTGRLWDS